MRVLLCAGAVLLIAAGCATRHGPPSPPPAPARTATPPSTVDIGVDYTDPAGVCLRFAAGIYRRDTDTDHGPSEAYRRASAAYATPKLAAAVAAQPDGRDPAWTLWKTHHAVTDPTVTVLDVDEGPVDTSVDAHRAAVAAFTPAGRDGWRGPGERHAVYCVLHATGGRWRVAAYTVGVAPAPPRASS